MGCGVEIAKAWGGAVLRQLGIVALGFLVLALLCGALWTFVWACDALFGNPYMALPAFYVLGGAWALGMLAWAFLLRLERRP